MESLWSSREAISSRNDYQQTKSCTGLSMSFQTYALSFTSLFHFPSLLFLSNLSSPHSSLYSCYALPFLPLYLRLIPLPHLSPSLTPLSPPLPLVTSQTNGAHYRLTKNSPAAKSIHFFLSVFLSFSLLMLLFFLFFVPPSGEK